VKLTQGRTHTTDSILAAVKVAPSLGLSQNQCPTFIQVQDVIRYNRIDQNTVGAVSDAAKLYEYASLNFDVAEDRKKAFVLVKSSFTPDTPSNDEEKSV
jgi:hypothetical protein